MLIKFKTVTLENFLSFGPRTEIQLSDRGYTLVEGINNDPEDNAYSNGSGKSSIFDAILYCLTGTTSRGTNKNLVNLNTDGDMRVTLTFSVDETEYLIVRGRDSKGTATTLKFYVNGEDKSSTRIRDTQEIINQYLPELTESLITSVIILGQGMPNKFTDNTPAGRKEILEKLSNSDFMIEDIKTKISDRKAVLTEKSRELELQIAEDTGILESCDRQLVLYNESLSNLAVVSEDEITAEKENASKLKQKLGENKVVLDEKNRALEEALAETSRIKDEKAKAREDLEAEWNPIIQGVQSDIAKAQALAESARNEISRLKGVVDVCPKCGYTHEIDTSGKEAELKCYIERLEGLTTQSSDTNLHYSGALRVQEEAFAQKVQKNADKIKGLRGEVADASEEARRLTDKYNQSTIKINALQQSYGSYTQRKAELQANIDAAAKEKSLKKEKIAYNNSEKESVESSLSVVNKMMTIATRDFRGVLLANVIEYLTSRAKIYCSDIFGTDRVELVLDGNNLNVSYDGKPYENLSGGEKKRLDIICQLSIRDMLSQFSNFSSNILVLDEFTDSLDKTSTEAVIDCLAKRLNDVESTFIVTHMTNLSIPTDSTITVVKDERGISAII